MAQSPFCDLSSTDVISLDIKRRSTYFAQRF